MALRSRVEKLEQGGHGSSIIAAAVAAGVIRSVLTADGVLRPPPSVLTVEQLPEGCRIYRYDAGNEIPALYLGRDGRIGVKVIEGLSEAEFLGGADDVVTSPP